MVVAAINRLRVKDWPDLFVDGEHRDQPNPLVAPTDDLRVHLVVLERLDLFQKVVADAGQWHKGKVLTLQVARLEIRVYCVQDAFRTADIQLREVRAVVLVEPKEVTL